MISDNQENGQLSARRFVPWLNLVLVLVLLGIGIWYISDKVSLADILTALRLADPVPVFLGLGIMLLTVILKAWRWQFMFAPPGDSPSYSAALWSLMLGQYVNLIVPFLRLGEVARIYALNRQTRIPMARSIGTLVVEKVLDLFMLVLMIALLMPFVILPEFVGQPGPLLWAVPILALLVLYILAFQTDKIIRIVRSLADALPDNWVQRPLKWITSGLEGLAALRSGRITIILVIMTAVIALLSILLPYVLFGAFDFELTLIEAALIHVVVTIATTPPSTPVKIGVFNGAAAVMLYSFGVSNDSAIIGYSILFYLVVIIPQIVLGSIAAIKTDWHWRESVRGQTVT
jgi:uncharacterized protein (TIRG00374 family)